MKSEKGKQIDLEQIRRFLREYDGPERNIMEVCGSHTEAVAKYGIPSLLSPKLHLLSGPGCPVCVTTSSYIDRLIELSHRPATCIVTFGDLIRVPGSRTSLSREKGKGAAVEMVYSPMDLLEMARKNPKSEYIFAAVGFETTAPVYAMLLEAVLEEGLENVRLLTAIKTMPEVINHLLAGGAPIDGFLAPGHVSVVTGSGIFCPIAKEYGIPFGVSGFGARELLLALYGIVMNFGRGEVLNYYPSVVTEQGNERAQKLVDTYFEKTDAVWRGLGTVPGSGKVLRSEYRRYDAGSMGLDRDEKMNPACCCDQVLMGKRKPSACPLFGKACNPLHPQGACMVSTEGSCFSYYANKRTD